MLIDTFPEIVLMVQYPLHLKTLNLYHIISAISNGTSLTSCTISENTRLSDPMHMRLIRTICLSIPHVNRNMQPWEIWFFDAVKCVGPKRNGSASTLAH